MATDILMYHSISEAGGPTSISPEIFASQMADLAESDMPVVPLDAVLDKSAPSNSVVITFDDAFEDFAEAAWPVLERHGFPAIVYVPTDHVGKVENWRGACHPPRAIMGWQTISDLAARGIDFGSHTRRHVDLDTLAPTELEEELKSSKTTLEDRLSQPIHHFAPPYGRAGPTRRQAIAAHYRSSVGTRLGPTRQGDDLYDLPRLEMHYFTSRPIWRQRLAGHGAPYLTLRKSLRAVRDKFSHPASRA